MPKQALCNQICHLIHCSHSQILTPRMILITNHPITLKTMDSSITSSPHSLDPSALHAKVANGSILFNLSRNSIKNHMTTNKCFSGDNAMLKVRQLENTLLINGTLSQFHEGQSITGIKSGWKQIQFCSCHEICLIVLKVVLLVHSWVM